MAERNLGTYSEPKFLPHKKTHCGFCCCKLGGKYGTKKRYLIHGAGSAYLKVGNKMCLLGEPAMMNCLYSCSKCYQTNVDLLSQMQQQKLQTEHVINRNGSDGKWNSCSSYVFVSMSSLFCLLEFVLQLGPTHIVGDPTISYIGSVLCITFLLADKSTHVWYSSPKTKNSDTTFDLNFLLPLAANLVGGKPSTVFNFLELLDVKTAAPRTWRRISEAVLSPVVEAEWKEEQQRVLHEMNSGQNFKLQEDEQHSRPQRNGSLGHAPFVTVTVIWARKNLICSLEHVDRAVDLITSAAACQLGRARAFCYISQHMTNDLLAIVTDACTGAATSVKQYLLPRWPKCFHAHDLWHKTRKWVMGLSEFCNKRPYPFARTHVHSHIFKSWSDGELLVGKLKRHFVYCAQSCNQSRNTFISLFCGAAEHYGARFEWPEHEIEAFKSWLLTLVERDAEGFIHGLQTSATESFHNVCNIYSLKGIRWSFSSYSMRKNLAALHWNTKQRGGDVHQMRRNILKKVLNKL